MRETSILIRSLIELDSGCLRLFPLNLKILLPGEILGVKYHFSSRSCEKKICYRDPAT